MKIADSFQHLLSKIAPLESDVAAIERHCATIRARLASAFKLSKFFKAGSYSRGTFIRGKSDVDVFAILSRDNVRRAQSYVSSYTALDNVKAELEGRFPASKVYRDINAVVVEFSDYLVDVVPGYYAGKTDNGWPLYAIPNGSGEWKTTSPGLHNSFIKKADEASGYKLRRTARLMKFWRDCRSPRVPISSFFIEMFLAKHNLCVGPNSYSQLIAAVLDALSEGECQGMRDPLRVSGNISAVKSDAQRGEALASIQYSQKHAKLALESDVWGGLDEARKQWDIVFRGNFPW